MQTTVSTLIWGICKCEAELSAIVLDESKEVTQILSSSCSLLLALITPTSQALPGTGECGCFVYLAVDYLSKY